MDHLGPDNFSTLQMKGHALHRARARERHVMDVKMNTTNNYGNLWVCEFSVHYKPTDSHSYLLYSSSHPSRIPFLILSFLDFVAFVVKTLISP